MDRKTRTFRLSTETSDMQVNGLFLVRGVEYTMRGRTITFTKAGAELLGLPPVKGKRRRRPR